MSSSIFCSDFIANYIYLKLVVISKTWVFTAVRFQFGFLFYHFIATVLDLTELCTIQVQWMLRSDECYKVVGVGPPGNKKKHKLISMNLNRLYRTLAKGLHGSESCTNVCSSLYKWAQGVGGANHQNACSK